MKRTLVTGAAGFTGRFLGPVLAAAGHEVHGLVHEALSEPISGYDFVHQGDVSDPTSIKAIVSDLQPEHVVHLAAIAFVAHDDVDEMYRVNVLGTRHLLQALSELGRKPETILLASSANVYGNRREGIADESLMPAPANDYGVSKIAMEYVASTYLGSLPLIIARPFNYTGRGQSRQFIIPKIVEHARSRAPVIELGNVSVARDFSDVRTIVDAYMRLLSTASAVGGTFNVCSGRAVSLDEVLETVARLSGHELEVRVNGALVRSNEVKTLCGSRAKIEDLIGPLKQITLEETLRWMLDA